jgi:ribosomal protein S12 methylthiotransferase
MNNNKKIYLISLGCPKNLVDSENILALLGEKGYILTDSSEESDILIVNTCGFLQSAVEESIGIIKKLCRRKQKWQKIIVYGCLIQRYSKRFPYIKGVDAVMGVGNPENLVSLIEQFERRKGYFIAGNLTGDDNYPRLITTYPYAYIKISEGCEMRCSYCIIPKIRGFLRSRKIQDIYSEAQSLKEMGIRELILISQNTTSYGKDLKGKKRLDDLIVKLSALRFHWLRIMYLHPAYLNERMLGVIAGEPGICRYLDIPLQHVHPEILKRMNRPVVDYSRIVDRIREIVPGVRLRTTFITGFPGESETHFKAVVKFVEEKEFDRMGVFCYSREEGTPAYDLPGQIPENIKMERERILMETQKKISRKKLERLIGTEMEVLIEGKKGQYFTGRTEFDAPEIDGTVYVKTKKSLKPGDFCTVTITSSTDYDLYSRF